MKSNKFLKLLTALILVTGINVFYGCSNDELNPAASSENSTDNLTLSFISDETVTDANEIIITEAKALVGEVELETEPSSQSIHLAISPFVVNLNSISIAELAASVTIPAGNYNKIKFQLHKPEDNETPPDPEFKQGNSGNQRFSIIVKGTYNGNPFTFKSRKSANVVIFLNSLLSISESSRNLTLVVNPAVWFKSGNNILDPNDDSNEDIIEDNIKNSFKRAFRDDNRDGRPDDN